MLKNLYKKPIAKKSEANPNEKHKKYISHGGPISIKSKPGYLKSICVFTNVESTYSVFEKRVKKNAVNAKPVIILNRPSEAPDIGLYSICDSFTFTYCSFV